MKELQVEIPAGTRYWDAEKVLQIIADKYELIVKSEFNGTTWICYPIFLKFLGDSTSDGNLPSPPNSLKPRNPQGSVPRPKPQGTFFVKH